MTVYILVFAMQFHTGQFGAPFVREPFTGPTALEDCKADMKRRIDKDRQTVRAVTGMCIPLDLGK